MGLYDYAQSVLASVVTTWAANTVDLPALRYVAPGPLETVSIDCDQVVVAFGPLTRGNPGEPITGEARVMGWSAVVSIGIWRLCMPTSPNAAPPPAAAQAAAAEITLRDLDLLWRNHKTLYDVGGCRKWGIVNARLAEIAGGAGGALITTNIDLLEI